MQCPRHHTKQRNNIVLTLSPSKKEQKQNAQKCSPSFLLHGLLKVPRMLPLLQRDQCRSRNRIPSVLSEEIELDARIRGLVEAGRRDTARKLDSAAALDLEVDALWVGLCAVRLAAGVQGDDFVADDVVSWDDGGDGEVLLGGNLEVCGYEEGGM